MKKKALNVRIKLPKSWNDLSTKQLEKIAFLFFSTKPSFAFDLKIFIILANVRWWQVFKEIKISYILSQVPVSELKKLYSFIYKENNRTIFPRLKILNKKLYAPMDRIINLSAEEFAVADDLHIKYRTTKNLEYLKYLCAVLYALSVPRPVFDKISLSSMVKQFDKITVPQMLAIEIAYFGSKIYIEKRYPKVFPKQKQSFSKASKNYGFGKVVLQMAGQKFGSHEETKKTNIYTFLEQFEEDLKQIADVKRNKS